MRLVACAVCVAALCVPLIAQSIDGLKKEKVALAKLSIQRDNVKSSMLKHRDNANFKHNFTHLNDNLAEKTMSASWLTPHEKYSAALRLYRYSLIVDPSDSNARQWVNMIESIYKSMHRPIPK